DADQMIQAVPLEYHLRMSPILFVSVISLNCAAVRSDEADVKLGREAAVRCCQNCHLLPKPELLDKETWVNGALPHMAPWVGVAKLKLASRPDGQRLAAAGIFPLAPLLSEKEWRALHAYYASAAPPEPLAPTNKAAAQIGLPLFRARTLHTTTNVPFTSLVRVDPANKRIYLGDAQGKTLLVRKPGRRQLLRACLAQWSRSDPIVRSRLGRRRPARRCRVARPGPRRRRDFLQSRNEI